MTITRSSTTSLFATIALALLVASCGITAQEVDPITEHQADAPCNPPGDPPGDPGNPQAIKWHPGTYVWYLPPAVNGVGGYRVDLAAHQARLLEFIDSIKDEPGIRGIELVVYWKALEGDTPGDYSAGFAAIDKILARLAQYNKRLMLGFQTVVFGNFANITDIFPAYIASNAVNPAGKRYGVTQIGFNGFAGMTARSWQRDTNDRIIALSQAYGARYDSVANLEMLTFGETALQVPFGVEGFSNQAMLDQLEIMLTAARGHWPHTALRVGANHLEPDPLMTRLFATAAALHLAVGGPDVWPRDVTQADRVFVGLNANHQQVYTDYRDQLPWAVEIQWQSFGGQFTLQQLYNATVHGYTANDGYVMPSMKTKYLIWYVNESNGNASTQWRTGELPFLRTMNAPHSTTCPSLYPACNPD